MWCLCAVADEVIPPLPTHYFNDYAHVVSSTNAALLDATLENYERESSDQIVVAVFQKMQSDAPIRDYTMRIFNSWGVGQKGKNNGVTLFVFIQDHKMYLNVGKGLEKTLPDATCKQILDTKIIPRFKQKDFDGGLSAGVSAIIAATKGAYQGNGQTATELQNANTNCPCPGAVNFHVLKPDECRTSGGGQRPYRLKAEFVPPPGGGMPMAGGWGSGPRIPLANPHETQKNPAMSGAFFDCQKVISPLTAVQSLRACLV
jgi:hypothetical protein